MPLFGICQRHLLNVYVLACMLNRGQNVMCTKPKQCTHTPPPSHSNDAIIFSSGQGSGRTVPSEPSCNTRNKRFDTFTSFVLQWIFCGIGPDELAQALSMHINDPQAPMTLLPVYWLSLDKFLVGSNQCILSTLHATPPSILEMP